jgi:hypothetical protein
MSPEVIRLIYPDIAVSRGRRTKRSKAGGGGTLLLEPVTIHHEFLEETRQARIDILHRPDRRLVAVLEMLSPFNKAGDGLDQYRNKRKTVLLQKVHLVELDLLVGGRRLPHAEPLPPGDYYALVSRVENRPNVDVYSWGRARSAADPAHSAAGARSGHTRRFGESLSRRLQARPLCRGLALWRSPDSPAQTRRQTLGRAAGGEGPADSLIAGSVPSPPCGADTQAG